MKKLFIFLVCCLTAMAAQADLFNNKTKFLPVDQAFQLDVQRSNTGVSMQWQIAENYYLYQDKLAFSVNGKPVENAPQFLSSAEQYEDPYFGLVTIFKHDLNLTLPLKDPQPQDLLEVTYQGCAKGFCYPPETKQFQIGDLLSNVSAGHEAQNGAETHQTSQSAVENANVFSSQQNQLAESLSQSKYAMLWFFVLGIGLAFTPCVLPMLPLLSAIVIGGRKEETGNWRALALSFVYVQGMALTYTLLGLVVVLIGLPFQIALQSPYVLIGLSVVFVLLALSMFGVFTLQLPSSLQTKLTQFSQQQKSGAFFGVFVMGAIAGLVASPCTSAPLSGALLYVAQSGDFVIGALTLYLLALGMGLPLILITVFGNKILPKSGAWMENVKTAFGFVMLALPIFLISRIIPSMWEPRLWALLGVSFFIWLATQMRSNGIGLFFRIVFFVAAMVSAQPLQNWVWQDNAATSQAANTQSAVQNSLVFQQISNYDELQAVLKQHPNKIAMLDLYADWCVACKEFEHKTFADPQVQTALSDVLLLRVDMTNNSESNRTLMKTLAVTGLPTIIFFNQQGEEIQAQRITGFLPAEAFMATLNAAKSANY
ncbi:protein-disulfide reductase DsbD [uncultured Aggregatibacter sp.]|uniref:protein-disulfide reductase DsbD n=1 Tax=uncultured Aggregatibacter sp. TaxID=470564 RepID=UPI0026072868|nr:protein-disulfide reductase DsbD [uncultured Aggregatibacter sp.]